MTSVDDHGELHIEDFEKALTPRTKLVAITHPKLRKLAEATRRHLDRVERSLQRLFGFGQEVLQHHARPVLDALLQSYQVALALSERARARTW